MRPELTAPKVTKQSVVVNLVIRGEPHAWKRAARRGGRTFDDPENIKAKENLVEKFEWAYPKWKQPISRRRLGVQIFAQTHQNANDIDNFAKLPLDAFNKKIWYDDRQICELYVFKHVVVPVEPAFLQIAVYLLGV